MPPRLLPLVVLLLPMGCTPSPSPDEAIAKALRQTDCGLPAALSRRLSRPGRDGRPLRSGDAIRACTLPTAAAIEDACALREGVQIPGTRNPDDPEVPDYSFPRLKVTAARCTFSDAGGSRASCRFRLAAGGARSAPAHAVLTHRFRDLSDDRAHGSYIALWEADGICRSE